MNFNLTEEQLMVKELCSTFSNRQLKPKAALYDKSHEFPWEHINKLKEMGMMGIVYPEEYNGSGMDYISYAIAIEELSRGCASTGVIVSAHNSLCISPIYFFGTEIQKESYLPDLCSGNKIGCFGITEPEAGSDAAGTKTTAVLDGDEYILNGTKNFITNGSVADIAVITAVTDKSNGHKGLSFFIVEKGTKGFSVGKHEEKLGIKASPTTELIFDNCRLPKDNIIGSPGDGFKISMHTLDGGRVGIGAQALGIAQAALDESLEYAKERKQFGKSISNFQAIQWMLADMATEINAARLLVYQAAEGIGTNNRQQYSKFAAMAKLYASELSHRVTHKAIQIFGGYGYTEDYPVERLYRDARITEIYEGTSEIQRLVIANSIL